MVGASHAHNARYVASLFGKIFSAGGRQYFTQRSEQHACGGRGLAQRVLTLSLALQGPQLLPIGVRLLRKQVAQFRVAALQQAITPRFDSMQPCCVLPRSAGVGVERRAPLRQLVFVAAQLFREKTHLALARDMLRDATSVSQMRDQIVVETKPRNRGLVKRDHVVRQLEHIQRFAPALAAARWLGVVRERIGHGRRNQSVRQDTQ